MEGGTPLKKLDPVLVLQPLDVAGQCLLKSRSAARVTFISSTVMRKYSMLFKFIFTPLFTNISLLILWIIYC